MIDRSATIVDLYHAKGHLGDVGKGIYGAGKDLAEHWGERRRDELDDGKIDDILAALALHVKTNDEARKRFDYVTWNRHRMRHPEFAIKAPVWVQALSKPAARRPYAFDASGQECTGPLSALMQSARSVAAN